MAAKWQSFSKDKKDPITFATIKHKAKENGWIEPVTFYDDTFDLPDPTLPDGELPFHVDDLDMLKPPGFVGEVVEYINSQCLYPRKRLAVATALSTVGDIGGLSTVLDDGMTRANTIFFCIAGSSTGKEAILQARTKLLRAAGIPQVQYGKWKSDKEIISNLLRHDQSSYVVDEIGIQLSKVSSAIKRGGAVYLEGIIGEIMSIFSKSLGIYSISGDLKDEVKAVLNNEIKLINKLAKDGEIEDQEAKRKIDQLNKSKKDINAGIENPFLSILGFTTPHTFEHVLSFENLTNGFLARALIVDEIDTNPKRKKYFKKPDIPESLERVLMRLRATGNFEIDWNAKIEAPDDLIVVNSTSEARDLIESVYEYQYTMAEKEKAKSGYEAIWRRLTELVNRVCLILAIPSGLLTANMVRWSFEYCRRNCQRKIELAIGADADDVVKSSKADQLLSKLLTIIDDEGETIGTIVNRCRRFKREDVIEGLARLEKKGDIFTESKIHPVNKTEIIKYKRIYG